MKITRISDIGDPELSSILDKNDRQMLDSFLKSFFQAVKNKYSLEGMQLKVTIEDIEPEKNMIPVSIFSRDLGIFESLVKYMHENLGLPNKEIAALLKRTPSNIAVTYSNAQRKMPAKYGNLDFSVKIPVMIFSKDHTCFESLCLFLKNNFTLHQIAVMLKRDDRTIWTVHHRAVRKGGRR